jgi:spoIIIJ-associated protein
MKDIIMAITEQQLELTRSNFHTMIKMLGLGANIGVRAENDFIHLNVTTEDPGRLIGRKGQTLNAIQHLLNGILLTQENTFPKVVIDVEGLNENKESRRRPRTENNKVNDKIKLQALEAVKEVKRWGEDVMLPSMSQEDCQLIQEILADDKEVRVSMSVADAKGMNRVTIQLKK